MYEHSHSFGIRSVSRNRLRFALRYPFIFLALCIQDDTKLILEADTIRLQHDRESGPDLAKTMRLADKIFKGQEMVSKTKIFA